MLKLHLPPQRSIYIIVVRSTGLRSHKSERYLNLLPHGYQHTAAYAALDKTGLEWTAFNLGWLLEYYGMPHVKTYVPQTTFVADMASKRASIPGDGKQKMTFTYSRDVAKFVVAALDLPRWDKDTIVIGDKMTWEEFVKLAEEARGMCYWQGRAGEF